MARLGKRERALIKSNLRSKPEASPMLVGNASKGFHWEHGCAASTTDPDRLMGRAYHGFRNPQNVRDSGKRVILGDGKPNDVDKRGQPCRIAR